MEGVNRERDDVIIECEKSEGMMSSWKGLIGGWMLSFSNVRIVRE
jgi:hypothetical protein